MLRKIVKGTILFSILFYCHGQDELCAGRASQKLSNAIDDCRPDNATAKVCNDRGMCICGVCSCIYRPDPKEKIYGKYCECDNFTCKRVSGQLCAGHGVCECGECRCMSEWSGPDCNCPTNALPCKDPENNEVHCNDHGDCVCGTCVCHGDQRGRYHGRYCEMYRKNETNTETN